MINKNKYTELKKIIKENIENPMQVDDNLLNSIYDKLFDAFSEQFNNHIDSVENGGDGESEPTINNGYIQFTSNGQQYKLELSRI